jgi:hypothetical protein
VSGRSGIPAAPTCPSLGSPRQAARTFTRYGETKRSRLIDVQSAFNFSGALSSHRGAFDAVPVHQ